MKDTIKRRASIYKKIKNCFYSSKSSSSIGSSSHSEPAQTEDIDDLDSDLSLIDIDTLRAQHQKEKHQFLSAINTFNRTASEFYKLINIKNRLAERQTYIEEYKKAVGGNEPSTSIINGNILTEFSQSEPLLKNVESSINETRDLKSKVLELWSERKKKIEQVAGLISFENSAKTMIESIQRDDDKFATLSRDLSEENWDNKNANEISKTIESALQTHRTHRRKFLTNKKSIQQLVNRKEFKKIINNKFYRHSVFDKRNIIQVVKRPPIEFYEFTSLN